MFRKTILMTFMSLMILAAAPALAGVKRVTVQVDGLACPFCTYNVEKRIKTLDGVPKDLHWEASVEKGTASFDWNPDLEFNEEAVREQVRKAGFTPRELYVTVAGAIEIRSSIADSAPQIYLTDNTPEFAVLITRGERADRQESWTQLLDTASGSTTSIRLTVTGLVQTDGTDGAWRVVLHRWSPVEFGAEVILDVEDLACEQCSTRTMRALGELDGVIHVEADHETDRVHIWTEGRSPDLSVFRERIETLGFKVTHIHDLGAEGVDVHDE